MPIGESYFVADSGFLSEITNTGGYTKVLFTTHKQSLRSLCFHRCLAVDKGVSVFVHGGVSVLGVSLLGGLCLVRSLSGGSLSRGLTVTVSAPVTA